MVVLVNDSRMTDESSPPSPPAGPSAPADEPYARGTTFAASRIAVLKVWGEKGLDEIGGLVSVEVRRATVDGIVFASDWLPERYMVAWFEAAWLGPARQQQVQMRRFVDERINYGFGRLRRLLLKASSPASIVKAAPDLWRHDHSTGHLSGKVTGSAIEMRLRDHPYTTTPASQLAVAEIYRYILSRVRGAKNVSETHRLEPDGTLVVSLLWERG